MFGLPQPRHISTLPDLRRGESDGSGAGGSVIPSQSPHENFSRTCSTIFQHRGSHASVFDIISPSGSNLTFESP